MITAMPSGQPRGLQTDRPATLPARVEGGDRGGPRGGRIEWQLKRNCSVTPSQALAFFASIGVVSLVIATAFWLHGATFVLPFTCLELLAVGTALLVYARHAGDCERVCLDDGRLIVERRDGNSVQRWEWPAGWVQVGCPAAPGGTGLIEFSGQGQRAEVGRHVRAELRRPLAREFRQALHAAAHA